MKGVALFFYGFSCYVVLPPSLSYMGDQSYLPVSQTRLASSQQQPVKVQMTTSEQQDKAAAFAAGKSISALSLGS